MRRLSALTVVVLLALAPVAQAAPRGPIQQWTQRKVAAVKKTFKSSVKRKHFIGKAGMWVASLGVGQGIDLALMAHGVPPLVSMSAGFVASAAPTLAQYPAQRALTKRLPAWFEPPEHRTGWQLTKDAAFAGVVGVAGGAAVSAVGSQITASVPVQKILMPLARAGLKQSGVLVGLVRWSTSQYANQKVSDASDKLRERVSGVGAHLRKRLLAAQ